jgi:hypothetical protein
VYRDQSHQARDFVQNCHEMQCNSSSLTVRAALIIWFSPSLDCVGRGDFESDLRRVIKR